MSAEYLIAQYYRSPMTREARNVGVVVLLGDDRAARFLAETRQGEIDGRFTKVVAHSNIYQKWVRYWREQIRKGADSAKLMETNGDNYNLIPGGFVEETGNDSAEMIAANLYSMLVNAEPEQVAGEQSESASGGDDKFQADVANEFRKRNILGVQSPGVHGVLRNQVVAGKKAMSLPNFE